MPEKKEAAADEAGIEERIRALDRMTTGELADEYERLYRRECRTRHRACLIRKIAWRLQANAEGDLSERARRRAAELADDAEVRLMAPRATMAPPRTTVRLTPRLASRGRHEDPRVPPPGSTIVRDYKHRTIRVRVLPAEEGFELDGERFPTLTAVAKRVTGQRMNGFRFFRLDRAGGPR